MLARGFSVPASSTNQQTSARFYSMPFQASSDAGEYYIVIIRPSSCNSCPWAGTDAQAPLSSPQHKVAFSLAPYTTLVDLVPIFRPCSWLLLGSGSSLEASHRLIACLLPKPFHARQQQLLIRAAPGQGQGAYQGPVSSGWSRPLKQASPPPCHLLSYGSAPRQEPHQRAPSGPRMTPIPASASHNPTPIPAYPSLSPLHAHEEIE